MLKTYESIRSYLDHIPIIDTHEHLPWSEVDRNRETDFLQEYLTHYMSSDLKSAGMPSDDFDRVVDIKGNIVERWELVEPYWNACRFTGYGRALDVAVKAIYGIDGINENTVEALDVAFKAALVPGHFNHVLKDICNIEASILDTWTEHNDCDRNLFRRVWQGTKYISPWSDMKSMISDVEKRHGLVVKSLDDWLEAFDRDLDLALSQGVVGLKSALAYGRTIFYQKRSIEDARSAFLEAVTRNWHPDEVAGDYIMHHILRRCNEKGLVFQMHTGLLEGNGNMLANSNPALLNNLLLEYPNVVFDLFHIGYPFAGTTAALAKMFPNVRIDMCWAHIISPHIARHALADFLDSVPYTKISAFGGDYLFADGVCGHLIMAKDNVAKVLADKVDDGVMDIDSAMIVAKSMFYDNPKRIFGI